MMIFRAHVWLFAAVCLLHAPDAYTATVVGIVSDGPQVRQLIPIEAIEAELTALTAAISNRVDPYCRKEQLFSN